MDTKETARRFIEGQEAAHGPEPELCASDYTARIGAIPPMDVDGHRAFSATFYDAFPDLKHHVKEIVGEGDRVAVRLRLTGTNTGPLMGKPASGRPIDVGAIVLLRIESGKVAELDSEFDQLSLLQQVGLIPAPSPA